MNKKSGGCKKSFKAGMSIGKNMKKKKPTSKVKSYSMSKSKVKSYSMSKKSPIKGHKCNCTSPVKCKKAGKCLKKGHGKTSKR